ncbi:hypothetical protein KPSA1_04435 [Pseudomonas syringae pv. actinidiae]|uniref:Uncharacterized protein n=1 Tax=Pseudomonas syringae pv. actinidiae TaxID=103796 RepID=A0A2V0QL66_PSESF|nr:hypothetical protein KPSA1_04435 [Pseudomonas syringae pv. actinidiae]
MLTQVMNQLIHQVQPVVIRRKAWVVSMLLKVRHLIFRRQRAEQLAVRGGREAIGVSEEHRLRHAAISRGRMSRNCAQPP